MFKWIGKLLGKKKEEITVQIYGKYLYKRVIARALSTVMGISQAELVAMVADPKVQLFLNDELIEGSQWARRRLDVGQYEIKIPSQKKVWRFFIE